MLLRCAKGRRVEAQHLARTRLNALGDDIAVVVADDRTEAGRRLDREYLLKTIWQIVADTLRADRDRDFRPRPGIR